MRSLKNIVSLLAIALATGASSTLFLKSLQWAATTRALYPRIIFLLPFAGVLLVLTYRRLGNNLFRGNILIHEELINPKMPLPHRLAPMIFLGTIFSHLFGASVGREGTAIQYGASFADWFHKGEHRKLFLHAGVSAGFASVFGTPWAGVLFGLESSRYLKNRYVFAACITSAWIAHLFAIYLGAPHSHYVVSLWPSLSPTLLISLIGGGICFGICARLYVFSKKFIGRILPEHRAKKIFCAGLVVSSYVYFTNSYDMLGLSLPVIENSFTSLQSWMTPIQKLFLTAISTGGGFLGGEVTPLFMMGSSLGSALSPILTLPMDFLAAMGLVAVFAGAARVPITSAVMACELFGVQAAPYAVVVCFISHLVNHNSHLYKDKT